MLHYDWQALVGSFAIVALFISLWLHGRFLLEGRARWVRDAVFGLVMGLGSIVSMWMAVRADGGILLDLRSSVMVLAGFFGGPVAAIVAGAIAIVCRLALGGATAWMGAVTIAMAGLVGVAVSSATRGRMPALWSAVLLALAVACIGPAFSMIVLMLGITGPGAPLPLATLNFAATLLCTLFIMRNRHVQRERDLLRAAFMQAPDFNFIKGRDSRFVAVNWSVARHHGFAHPDEMDGKSDYDLSVPGRADALFAEEQQVMASGGAVSDREEMLVDAAGRPHWYSTSIFPLHNEDQQIAGIAGVTRDITRRRELEQEIEQSRNLLNAVLGGIADGVAMFDRNGVLVYLNENYARMFPLTADIRVPGAHLRDILAKVSETGEQVLPAGSNDIWLESVMASLHEESEEEVELYDGRWLFLRTNPAQDGSAMVVVSDVTKIKRAEATLRGMTEQLKLLATTDGLTGLTNRRAFDVTLESELARCRRSGEPISLLLVDVDRFKAYNDHYGHPAGDEILKSVGKCLADSLRRPGDVAARYGGEEFVAILPGTDEDGAYFIADAFRERLRAAAIPHAGSEKGMVTASVGLACFTERDGGMNATELVRRADEALYNAKGAGRDRIAGWRAHHEVRPVRGFRG